MRNSFNIFKYHCTIVESSKKRSFISRAVLQHKGSEATVEILFELTVVNITCDELYNTSPMLPAILYMTCIYRTIGEINRVQTIGNGRQKRENVSWDRHLNSRLLFWILIITLSLKGKRQIKKTQ